MSLRKTINMVKKLKYTKILIFLFLIYFCYYRYLRWWGYPVTKYSPTKLITSDNFIERNSVKRILMWTNYFSDSPEKRTNALNEVLHCSKQCLYIGDRNELLNANAILFHSNADNLDMNDLPSMRNPSQYYIFLTQESPPKAAAKNFHQVWRYFPQNFFNLTMTYRQDSDIVASYDEFIEITANTSKTEIYTMEDVERAVEKKSKAAIVFVKNCYSGSGRETIIRKLRKLLDIDQFGYCSGRKCDKECEERIIGEYYFFLAFENNICEHYVTEKFWRIKKLIVPIVLQRSVTSKIAPKNSFIAVDDFKDIKELADYLSYLMNNETAYMEYFEWTKIYQKQRISWDESYCKLCERINKNNNNLSMMKSYDDINQWFDSTGTCNLVFMNGFYEFLIFWKKTTFAIIIGISVILFVIYKTLLFCYCKR